MHRVNRCTLAGTVWAPTSANRVPAHCHPLPGRPPYRAAARSTRPTIPRAPRPRIRPTARAQPCAHCTSITYALLPSSASLYIAIEQIQNRRLGRCHREVPPASPLSRLPCAAARIAPTVRRHPRHSPISLLALRRPQGPGWQEPRRMHPFFAECAKKAPFLATSARNACSSRSRWQHPRPMHPFPGAIGRFGIHGVRILPPRALFASRNPKSRTARRCCQRCAAFPRQRPALRLNGLCAMRQRHATRGMAERALRPAARAWPACRMRAPCHLACARRPRSSPPSYTRRASPPASRPRTPPSAAPPIAVGMSCRSGSSCRPRAAHADASRPSMRARRHRLGPSPRQPSPSPEPTESRPPVEPSAPIRAPPPAAPHPAARVPLRFR